MNVRYAYFGFLICSILAAGSLVHVALFYFHAPLSTHGSLAHSYFIASGAILLLTSLLSLITLLTKNGSDFVAMLIWLIMIFGLYSCLVVIVRSSLWLTCSPKEKQYDMENQTIHEFQSSGGVDVGIGNIMKQEHCCGIESILDWSKLKALAAASTGDFQEISETALPERFVPNECCVEIASDCGNSAYDYIVETYFTGTPRQTADSAEFDSAMEDPSQTTIQLLEIPEHLELMLTKMIDWLQDLSSSTCSLPLENQINTSLYVYYHGKVRLNAKGDYIACNVDDHCSEVDNILYKFPKIEEFCRMVNDTHDLRFMSEPLQIELLNRSGVLYVEGCKDHVMKYVDNFTIISLVYAIVTFFALCWGIGNFHEYYWRYKEIELQVDRPNWFAQFEHENDIIRSVEQGNALPTVEVYSHMALKGKKSDKRSASVVHWSTKPAQIE